jgi:hypothetical protein
MSQRTWMWIIGLVVIILAIYFFMGSNEPEAPVEAPAATTEPAAPATTTEPAAPAATEPAAPATTEPAAPATTEPAAPATTEPAD